MTKQLYFPFLCMQQLTSYLIHWAIPEKNDLYTDIDNNDHIYVYIYMMYIYSIFTWKLALIVCAYKQTRCEKRYVGYVYGKQYDL